MPRRWALRPTAATPHAACQSVDSQWWLAFGDTQLNTLIDQAVAGNPNLQVAQARLARAQASADIAGAGSQAAGQAPSSTSIARSSTPTTSIRRRWVAPSQNIGLLQLGASWELDFFGKNRTALDTAIGAANAAAADADAARVLLASNVARSYFQWARLNDQLTVASARSPSATKRSSSCMTAFPPGSTRTSNCARAKAACPKRASRSKRSTNRSPSSSTPSTRSWASPTCRSAEAARLLGAVKPMALQANIPADLLGRRADIAAARWRVEAATSDVANAKTLFYPNVNLTAFVGFQSLGFGKLLKSGSEQWGVGPAISLPIFEGGKLRANLRGKSADLDVAIESYNATVIDAVRDAADQVSSAQSITRQQTEQRAAQTAAEGAYDIAVQRYRAGLGNYLNVLTAETSVLAQRRLAVDLAARALDTQVALARALGGGWQPPATATASAAERRIELN
jgi:NodT family efflux transporter outer membrane factor (OMF) lipoprotein